MSEALQLECQVLSVTLHSIEPHLPENSRQALVADLFFPGVAAMLGDTESVFRSHITDDGRVGTLTSLPMMEYEVFGPEETAKTLFGAWSAIIALPDVVRWMLSAMSVYRERYGLIWHVDRPAMQLHRALWSFAAAVEGERREENEAAIGLQQDEYMLRL